MSCVLPSLKSGLPYQLTLHRSAGYGTALPRNGGVSTVVKSTGVISDITPSQGSIYGGVEVAIRGFGFTSNPEKVDVNATTGRTGLTIY